MSKQTVRIFSPERPWLKHYDPHVPPTLEYPRITLVDLLNAAVEKYPENVFVRFRQAAFTYGEMGGWIDHFSRNLLKLGVKKGERVAMLLPNLPQFVIAYYAILRIGGIVVALNPNYKLPEYQFLFRNAAPMTVICLDTQIEMIRQLREETPVQRIITTSQDDWKGYPNSRPERTVKTGQAEYQMNDLLFGKLGKEDVKLPEVKPDDPAIYQYSGGTTGTPKAAIGLQRNIVANVFQFKSWCDLQPEKEVILAAIPLYHVYGMVLAMNLGVALGAEIVLIDDARDVEFILNQIEQHKVTFYPGVPSMYYAINQNEGVRAGRHDLRSIKACISGSAPLHPQIKEDFERFTGGRLVEGYGLSEAPTATHCNPLYGRNVTGSIGLPLPDVECRVVDLETGDRIVQTGEVGELTLRGPQVMRAYHNDPEETRLVIRNGWLYTGDVVRMDEDGYFYIVDRKKDLIKVNGFQVWPNEIESVINTHSKVVESAVGGIPDLAQGEKVIAWVVRREEDLSAEEVMAWCRRDLAAYKLPAKVRFIEKLPRTGVGKVLRRELVREYLIRSGKN